MTTGDRMKARRKELKLSAEDVATALNVSRATIFRYEKGDIEKLPGTSLEPLAKVLQTTVAYLMGWSDESSPAGVTPSSANLVTIHYAGPVAAHFNATSTDVYEQRTIPAEWIGRRKPEDFFLATVSGDSMYPQFQDGDEILCLRCSDMGISGRIGIMLLGGDEATVKRIEYKPGEDWIDLIPINPEFKPRRIEGVDLEQCRVVGRVIKVIRTVEPV